MSKKSYTLLSFFGLLFILIGYVFLMSKLNKIDKAVEEKEKELIYLEFELKETDGKLVNTLKELQTTEEVLESKKKLITDIENRIESSKNTKLLSEVKEQVNLNKTFEEKINNEKRIKSEKGYAYYGKYKNNEWVERNFENLKNAIPEKIPEVGDIVRSLVRVNIREGVIEYNEEAGWVNKDIIGGIVRGVDLKVIGVHKVAGGNYIWIEFEKKS